MTESKNPLRAIVNTENSQFKPYDRYGEPISGMQWVPLSGELLNGEFESFLLKMAPGARSKPHEHMGFEEFYMVEGTLIDNDNVEFNKGDFVKFSPGSKHSSHTPNGCTLLVMLRGGTNRGAYRKRILLGLGVNHPALKFALQSILLFVCG